MGFLLGILCGGPVTNIYSIVLPTSRIAKAVFCPELIILGILVMSMDYLQVVFV